MENLTLETLPKAFTQLTYEVSEIKRLLLEKSNQPAPESDRWFNINELIEYLPDKPAKQTVYGLVHNRSIPFHKGAKKLRFLKADIDHWLMTGKRKTHSEIKEEAGNYFVEKIKRGNK